MMVSYMIMLVMSEPFSVCESMPRDVHTVLKSQCMTVFAALLQLSVETQGMVKKEQSPLLMSSAEVRQSSSAFPVHMESGDGLCSLLSTTLFVC